MRGKSWISLGSTGFALPGDVRRRLVRSSARGANGLTRTLEQFGIAPWRWETNKRIAGTERIGGVEVVRVATGVNVARVLRDANTLLGLQTRLGITRATGVPPVLRPSARRVLARSVTAAAGSSWIGVADRVLHKAGFTLTFKVAEQDRAELGGVSGGTIAGELNVSQVGKPQRIAAPETIGRFADFEVGLDALGDAQDAR